MFSVYFNSELMFLSSFLREFSFIVTVISSTGFLMTTVQDVIPLHKVLMR